MSEKPILFSGPMVRAILEGNKTQTRRIMKPQPEFNGKLWTYKKTAWDVSRVQISDLSPIDVAKYQVGDILWVRETWCKVTDPFVCVTEAIGYKATNDFKTVGNGHFKDGDTVFNWEKPEVWKFKPSLFMPRWASRIELEITGVKAERLQDISEEDARAEGYPQDAIQVPKDWFTELWDSINKKEGTRWVDNPWVFAYTFRLVK